MTYDLASLYDLTKLQSLLDNFQTITGISAALVDHAGNILVSSRQPALCEKFYDAHPDSDNSCRRNRITLAHELPPQPVRQCPHGLLDAGEPIIIQGECLGALLIGQVFAEAPDPEQYRVDALRYGFDPTAFLRALELVPVVSVQQFDQALNLMVVLTAMLADQGVARLQAEASNRLKSELLANLSHELLTPINGIIGGSQLLRYTTLTDEQNEYLRMIDESSDRELVLINNLLELVAHETDGGPVEHALFSLQQCLDNAMDIHADSARTKGLALFTELPLDLSGEVRGDGRRLGQVLGALVGNAVKFTEQGTVLVRVMCHQREQNRLIVRFSVIDTGIGIEPDKLETIFEPFIQSDMSYTRQHGGLGLGLTICQRHVQIMGGRIWAESSLGLGSSFHVEVPLTERGDA